MALKKTDDVIEIRPLKMKSVKIKVVGDSPLIMHAWSDKAKRMILEAQMGQAKAKAKDVKNPMEDFIHSMYWLTPMPKKNDEDSFTAAILNGARFGFPVTAFKQAATSAAYRLGWVKNQTALRGAFQIEANEDNMVEIVSDPPIMREDMVKVGMGTADIRYRGEFRNWSAELSVIYNANSQFSLENIVNVINAGGFVCGVGEWRPERDGRYGMYHVESAGK